MTGDLARCAQNSSADLVADGEGQAEAKHEKW
jgi:hypothetical protein